MSESIIITFILNGIEINVQSDRNQYMKDIFSKFCIKASKKMKDIYFLYKGEMIDKNLKLNQINNKDKEIKILVNEYSNDMNNKSNQNQNKINIICPRCEEICVININNYQLSLSECENGHNTSNLLFQEYYNKIKNIDESKIKCNQCNKKISESYNNQFYKCVNCNINLCPLCNSNHDNNHITIDYELKNYICYIHKERYISYCPQCKMNLCDLCEMEHNKNHILIFHKDISPNKEIKNNLEKLKKSIENYKEQIKDIIKIIHKTNEYFEMYYKFSEDILNSYNNKKRNYQLLKSINNIDMTNKNIITDLDKIINENDKRKQFEYIKDIYDKIIGINKNIIDNSYNIINLNINNMNVNNNLNNMNVKNNNMNNFLNNIMNLNNMNNINNNKERLIFVTFTFEKYGKQIFLDVDENETFGDMVKELKEKYNWLRSLSIKKFFFNNKEINNFNKKVKELNLINNSDIKIRV